MTKSRLSQNGKSGSARSTTPTKLAHYRTCVLGAKVPPASVPRVLYLDTANSSLFSRVHRIPIGKWSEETYDLLIVGGEHRQTGQPEDAEARWAGREDWTRQRFPMICGIEYGFQPHHLLRAARDEFLSQKQLE